MLIYSNLIGLNAGIRRTHTVENESDTYGLVISKHNQMVADSRLLIVKIKLINVAFEAKHFYTKGTCSSTCRHICPND